MLNHRQLSSISQRMNLNTAPVWPRYFISSDRVELHLFKKQQFNVSTFERRTPCFSLKRWCLSPLRQDEDWKHLKEARFAYVLSKEHYLNSENSPGSKLTFFAQKAEKPDSQCRRNIRIKRRQTGDSPQLSSNPSFSSSLGLKPKKKREKRLMEFKDVWQMDSRDAVLAPSSRN